METMISQSPHYWGPILSTRPMSYTELLKRSLRLYFASFSRVILVASLFSIVIFLPRLLSYGLRYEILDPTNLWQPRLLWLIVIDLLVTVLLISMFWRVHCTAHYKDESLNEDLGVGIHKVLTVFFAVVLQSIIIFGILGLLLAVQLLLYKNHLLVVNIFSWQVLIMLALYTAQVFIVLYIATLFIFLIPLIAIENRGIFKAIEGSIALSWNHWWRIFSTQVTPWVLLILFLLFVKFVAQIDVYIYFLPQGTTSFATILLQIILFSLFIIWPVSLIYLQMKDIELRKRLLVK